MDARWLLADAEEKQLDNAEADPDAISEQQKRELAEYMEDYYAVNQAKIDKLFALFQLSVGLLAVEAAGFMFDLTT